MSAESIEVNATPQNTESVTQPELRKSKSSWYTMLKQNPEAYAEYRAKCKQKYEADKLFRQLNGIEKPPILKKPYTYKPTPEKNTNIMLNIIKHIKRTLTNILKNIVKGNSQTSHQVLLSLSMNGKIKDIMMLLKTHLKRWKKTSLIRARVLQQEET